MSPLDIFPSLCQHLLSLMNEYSYLIQTLLLNKGWENPETDIALLLM